MKVTGIEMAKLDRRTLVMFSPVRNALNREIINHPQLMEKLRQQPTAEFEIRLASIAPTRAAGYLTIRLHLILLHTIAHVLNQ